jgi:hypothetical protein
MIYINVWEVEDSIYVVGISNIDSSEVEQYEELEIFKSKDVIRANVFAQQLYNIITEGKGTAIAVLNTF